MPIITLPRTYTTGETPTEQDLMSLGYGLETVLNTTKLDDANLQASSVTADKLASESATTQKFQSNSVTAAKLAAAVSTYLCPPGQILPYCGASAPTGWLLCNGSAVSRSTYADLYAVIGNTHGEGNGSTTFNVPDFCGRFLRGMDDGQGRDPNAASRTAMNTGGNTGDAIGTVQGGATALATGSSPLVLGADDGNHTHDFQVLSSDTFNGTLNYPWVFRTTASTTDTASSTLSSHSHTITGGGDDETRPVNAYVNFIIKT